MEEPCRLLLVQSDVLSEVQREMVQLVHRFERVAEIVHGLVVNFVALADFDFNELQIRIVSQLGEEDVECVRKYVVVTPRR